MRPIQNIRKNVFRLSQQEFADLAGVTQPTVSRWERGVALDETAMRNIRAGAVSRGIRWDDRLFFEVFDLPARRRRVAEAA